ncbi:hypothetical protein RJ640_005793 [Escallonia rubra]|uniref:Uncharacterized protein n=1 Tax=Escallonia rubra TaxID=112253 RepID=A0AA88QQV1_9ASTE|nr:hypothetical protein RJ640_005793 [Escallonia rubra]
MDGDRGLNVGTTGTIDLSGSEAAVDLSGQVHQLPCCIKYDGPCSVSQYFKPKPTGIEIDGLNVKEAHFRGRKLQGTTIALPQGFSGFVIGKRNSDGKKFSDLPEGNSNHWQMKAKFQDITLWNHDSLPSQDDASFRTFHWFAVSKANSHGYSKSRLGCFNGSLYIFPFTRSMGKKWTIELHQRVTSEDLESAGFTQDHV